jgi:sortase (surface protein transpeptidase)
VIRTLLLALVFFALGCGHSAPYRGTANAYPASIQRDMQEPIHRVHNPRDEMALGVVIRDPAKLIIPSVGVDAPVEHVDFLAVPKDPKNVAWFRSGAAPGQPGTATFDGHLDWTTGPAVFWNLSKLKPGDQVFVTGADGQRQGWAVDLVESVSVTSTPPVWLYANDGPPRISLITCGGTWLGQVYSNRLLVRAIPASL